MNNDLDKYQAEASKFAKSEDKWNLRVVNWSLGLCGESGELADEIKKIVFHKKRINIEDIKKELGDIMWYLSQLCTEFGFSMSSVAEENINKLTTRHGDFFKSHYEQNREVND